jgi:hypothetical protein
MLPHCRAVAPVDKLAQHCCSRRICRAFVARQRACSGWPANAAHAETQGPTAWCRKRDTAALLNALLQSECEGLHWPISGFFVNLRVSAGKWMARRSARRYVLAATAQSLNPAPAAPSLPPCRLLRSQEDRARTHTGVSLRVRVGYPQARAAGRTPRPKGRQRAIAVRHSPRRRGCAPSVSRTTTRHTCVPAPIRALHEDHRPPWTAISARWPASTSRSWC